MTGPPQFISVQSMLLDVVKAVGEAAGQLPILSRSPVGAIALHRAKITMSFELTSSAQTSDASTGVGPMLGVKSLTFGVASTENSVEDRAVNRGVIDLEIVAIADKLEDEPAPRPSPKPIAEQPVRPIAEKPTTPVAEPPERPVEVSVPKPSDPPVPEVSPEAVRQKADAIWKIVQSLRDRAYRLSEREQRVMMAGLREIESLLNRGQVEAAEERLTALIAGMLGT